MGWIQFLDPAEIVSEEIGVGAPFVIRIEGASNQSFKLYSRRDDGEYDDTNFIDIPFSTYLVYSFPDTYYELRSSSSGATAYWNTVLTTQTDLTRGR